MISLILIYLWFVLKVGPDYMNSRKPFDLTGIIRAYNIFQVIACSWFIVKFHQYGFSFRNTWRCIDEVNAKETITDNMLNLYKTAWWFLMLRVAEFVETIFFVLKKKQNQISTLHVYHHISTAVLLWLFFRYSASIFQFFFFLLLNCNLNFVGLLILRHDGNLYCRYKRKCSCSNVLLLLHELI